MKLPDICCGKNFRQIAFFDAAAGHDDDSSARLLLQGDNFFQTFHHTAFLA
ncbi:hypothetical protein D3C83_129440 [compost metagenome]